MPFGLARLFYILPGAILLYLLMAASALVLGILDLVRKSGGKILPVLGTILSSAALLSFVLIMVFLYKTT
jgi:uncharacterized membrane protein